MAADLNTLKQDLTRRMDGAIETLKREFNGLRTGRAHPGLLEPVRSGPGGRNRVYSSRDRTRLKLTLRAKRLGLSLNEAKDLIDMYDSPRDTVPQLKKFLVVLAEHRQQLESQLSDLEATLDEVKTHEKETRSLLTKASKAGVGA